MNNVSKLHFAGKFCFAWDVDFLPLKAFKLLNANELMGLERGYP